MEASNKWEIVCEHLRCSPPTCSFPEIPDLGQRHLIYKGINGYRILPCKTAKRDKSPWIIEQHKLWNGIHAIATEAGQRNAGLIVKINDCLEFLDTKYWLPRDDTFTDNLALFRASNIEIHSGLGATLNIKRESLGVREYSAASFTSRDQYLFGKFEAIIRASNAPGVVTGFFLHRNSPRQEIDIEIAGNRTDRLLVNVFYNPGSEGANFDYGYRGAASYINLGFDASEADHLYTIEWRPCEILWYVDNRLVHKRTNWEPTPIPHLPMALHVNAWPSRSKELAGRLNNRRLPSFSLIRSVTLEANGHLRALPL